MVHGSDAEFCLVLVTVSSEAEATAIAQTVVQEKLAACVNLIPVRSVYIWQDQLQQEPEWQLLIKTTRDRCSALQERILALHSYEVPEILAIPIQAGSPSYLAWIETQVNETRE
ncbi:MAG: divalent-cation tolerance protein CutA [Acaryochloridaceae cyanobacterium RU_4_10]|nr:divalent-cation tolerance protein CutA [Acaryochloridaceae cyanobacterium RU_4_10]